MKVLIFFFLSVLITVLPHKCFGDFTLYDNEHLTVDQTHDRGNLYDTSSALIIFGGKVYNLDAWDHSSVNISGGWVIDLRYQGYSSGSISEGKVDSLFNFGSGSVTISDADIINLHAWNGSLNISGGNIINLNATVSSVVTISGGYVNGLGAAGDSSVSIYGGSMNYLNTYNNSTVTFYGKNFFCGSGLTLNGSRVMGTGQLSGEWIDGTEWMININGNEPTSIIQVIPEPATLLLLGLGMVMLKRKCF